MAIRDILFHLDSDDLGRPTSEFALSLAASVQAHLTAGGVAIDYLPPSPSPALGMGTVANMEILAEITQRNRQSLEESFARLNRRLPTGVELELVMIQGLKGVAFEHFARLARRFDLCIVAQGAPEAGQDDRAIIASALFGSGRPVFIVPYIHRGPAKLVKAMVCWDGGVPATRALAGALPLLALADSVEIVSFRSESAAALELPEIARHLERHGISARWTELPGGEDVGEALLSHAADIGADYIVMGAYGHWRISEFFFGGTTRTLLSSMTVPVLMAH